MKSRACKVISLTLAGIAIAAVLSVAVILEPAVKIYGYAELDENRLNGIKNSLVICDDEGNSEPMTAYAPISSVSKHTIDAFLCAEDKRFYMHEGVDYFRILSAIIRDIKDGGFTQGASTITQQLVKNSHLDGQKNIKRKIQEIRLAKAVERKYSKNEILEMYLNILYFGNGTYGIASAARNLFDKSVAELSLRQSSVLAAIINNPSKYNPYENPQNLLSRSNLILKLMKDNGKISEQEYEDALCEDIRIKEMSLFDKYKYYVIKDACRILGCKEEYLIHNNIRIRTNCNAVLQKRLSELIAPYDARLLQIIVVHNKTGKIVAHEAKCKGDPSDVMRSPGSTIKPIVCYAPALEKDIIVPITPILDQKTEFGDYTPSNYKNKYYGWVSCKFALKESLNVPAVKLLDAVGLDYAKNFATSMGIPVTEDEGLALALGGMKYGVSLRNLADAYSVFARGGTRAESSYIEAIYHDDKLMYSSSFLPKRVIKEETAYFINDMLSECAKDGTAKRLHSAEGWAAKTGTVGDENGNSDAYCIAYSPSYTIGVHIMQKNGAITGGGLPTKLANQLIMTDINSDEKFKVPETIKKIQLNAIEYNKNQRLICAETTLPKKDRIDAEFPIYNLPPVKDERSDYEKALDLFDMNNFTIVDGFFN